VSVGSEARRKRELSLHQSFFSLTKGFLILNKDDVLVHRQCRRD
jgi:hypothetical protein